MKQKIFILFLFALSYPCFAMALINGETAIESNVTNNLSSYVVNFRGCTLTRISEVHFIGAAHCITETIDNLFHIKFGPNGEFEETLHGLKSYPFISWSDYISQSRKVNPPSDLMIYEVSHSSIDLISSNGKFEIKIAKINFNFTPENNSIIILSGYGGYDETLIGHDQDGNEVFKPTTDGKFRTAQVKFGTNSLDSVSDTFISVWYDGNSLPRFARGDSGGPLFNQDFEIIGINSSVKREYQISNISRVSHGAKSSLSDRNIPNWINSILGTFKSN